MKKKNKLIASLLIVTTFFSNLAGVSAKTLTINEVDKAFKNAMKENLGMTWRNSNASMAEVLKKSSIILLR